MDMPLTKKEIVLERNSVNGPPSTFRDLRTMLAASNLNYGGGSAKHDTGVHFSPVFSACIGQPMMNETAEYKKTRVRQRAMWARRWIITDNTKRQKKRKKEISPAPLNMKITFITFWYLGVWLSARLIKGRVVTSFSSFLFGEPGVNDFKCYLISISFFILAVSFFSALNDVI